MWHLIGAASAVWPQVELVPGGHDLEVTEENKADGKGPAESLLSKSATGDRGQYCGWLRNPFRTTLKNPGMLRLPVNTNQLSSNSFPWFRSGAGFRPSTVCLWPSGCSLTA